MKINISFLVFLVGANKSRTESSSSLVKTHAAKPTGILSEISADQDQIQVNQSGNVTDEENGVTEMEPSFAEKYSQAKGRFTDADAGHGPNDTEINPSPAPEALIDVKNIPINFGNGSAEGLGNDTISVENVAAAARSVIPVSLPGGFSARPMRGIGSWFVSSLGRDYTNGNSWCGYPYNDYTAGFAPDIRVMTGGKNSVWPSSNWAPSARKYCGLEAKVYNPKNGVTLYLYIIDAFDWRWLKSPGSIDVMIKSWESLTQRTAASKLMVIQDLQWTLTGYRNPKYAFKGKGDPDFHPRNNPALIPRYRSIGNFGGKVFAPIVHLSRPFDLTAIRKAAGTKRFVFGFITAKMGRTSWNGKEFTDSLTYRAQAQAVRAAGGDVILSFGGPEGREIAMDFKTESGLATLYTAIVNNYAATWIDFYLTWSHLTDVASYTRRNKALRIFQAKFPNVRISFTLPSLPTGLVDEAQNVLRSAYLNGLRIDVVNLLTMNWGGRNAPNAGTANADYVISAVTMATGQLRELRMDTSKLGITPMIGKNAIQSEFFRLADLTEVMNWARRTPLVTYFSFWATFRDRSSESGISQTDFQFSREFTKWEA